ncbi:hypothetical protein M446_7031 (plasmid) [Methylobacterium sp. 4-46]|uniref:hypothetical protein n=1 Tax=unclassified Methylobacterium TaxID=2615210 RepID=UPI000165CC3B|nr:MULTISPECIES: hypothetical protein [Methylobacterium]ACA21250.1 hypothetical protein M446_7031 [Methylobacterium sp. 4-46]WFT83758.1 hypothetical protein QA634_35375 [Methylobacterium nodulans]
MTGRRTLYLPADQAKAIKATGRGHVPRIEKVLREALQAGKLDAPRDLLEQAPKR